MKTLALCIPAYNAAAWLPRLLTSAKNQSIPFDEILVYNDSSTDNTAEIAAEYGAKVISGAVNIGCSAGKNVMLSQCSCDFIHFHDADDELTPGFTSLAHKWMDRADCPDVVLFDFGWRDNTTNELIGKSDFNDQALQEDPVRYAILHQINPFCGLYKKDSVRAAGGYDTDPAVLYNEDVAFHCRLAIAGLTFRAEKTVSIINYRIENSMSAANQLKCAQAHFYVMRGNATKVGTKYAKEIAYMLWKNAGVLASMSDWKTAKIAAGLAAKLDGPHGPRSFRWLAAVDPFLAVYAREQLIRLLKPHLRKQLKK